jgi:hypothetical protein
MAIYVSHLGEHNTRPVFIHECYYTLFQYKFND